MNIEADSVHVQQRLALLVRAGEIFHQSLDIEATLHNIARLVVESFADLCLFDMIDESSERLYVTAAAHRDTAQEPLLRNLDRLLYKDQFGLHPVMRVTRTGEPFFVPAMDEVSLRRHAASDEHANFMRTLGYRSKIVVPVTSQDQMFGALTFVRTQDAVNFNESDVEFALELGRRAGLAIANAKQYRREQHVAETLQRAFLTREFPSRPGLAFHALYRPGLNEAELGGDWYDAFETKAGSIVMAIGDVAGKGVDAARMMVQLRQAVRIAAVISDDPSVILQLVNQALFLETSEELATAFVGVIDKEQRLLRYASAGHVPPFLRNADGRITQLSTASAPLGVIEELSVALHELRLEGDMLLVLYTDGVTEITRDLVAGEAMLERVLASEAVMFSANPARYIERAVAGASARDDIAIMTVRIGYNDLHWKFEAGDVRAAYAIKADLMGALREACNSRSDFAACELIFAELIGNAVRHAPGALSLALQLGNDEPALHVIDQGPGFDFKPELPTDVWSECGRGLFLVSRLARGVDVTRLPSYGSHVRVRLPATLKRTRSAAVR